MKVNENLIRSLFGGPYDYKILSGRKVTKIAEDKTSGGWSDQRKQYFKDILRHNLVKSANESLHTPADLQSPDPHNEYIRRAQALDKTGEEMQPRDVVLAAQAYHTLVNHARRAQKLKG